MTDTKTREQARRQARRIAEGMTSEDIARWADIAILDCVSSAHEDAGFSELPREVRRALADEIERIDRDT